MTSPINVPQAFTFLLTWLLVTTTLAGAETTVLPGNHPLTPSQAGDVLTGELRCGACHDGVASSRWRERTAPDLSDVGARVAPDYLQRFLMSPSSAHPGTTMPDLIGARPEAERSRIAEALTHFLVAQSKSPFSTPSRTAKSPTTQSSVALDRATGKSLFHSVGCVACHGPQEAAPSPASEPVDDVDDDDVDPDNRPPAPRTVQPIYVPLAHVASKYSIRSLGDFLFEPLRVRSSGRMPDMKLTPNEALAIASYLLREDSPQVKPLAPQAELVDLGKKYFQELNCAACHALPGMMVAPKRGSLQQANLTLGCLSLDAASSPRYQLNDAQRTAITDSLREAPTPDTDQLVVAKTLTTFRCIACHTRDDYGGVHETHNPFFTSSEQKLGDDGRIPPPLTLVGAKLQPTWMKKVLFDGESVRHYMATRMPQYGIGNLEHLPDLLRRVDVFTGVEMRIPVPESRSESERERAKLLREAGRALLGDKGLNCIACHNFNGKAASGNQGIDLLTSYPRLQPGWFHAYVRNPGAFRPRTVMPTAWPDGVATHRTILNGDTNQQIEAIWFYLSLGTSAADPPGVRGVNTQLTVENQAKTYRGRSRVAGFRGIAVGLPEKLNYAFNAETGTLSAIWQGPYISVNWSGQGSGDFQPAGDAILFAQDVSFAQLADENSPWPRMPVLSKEARTNPDPLYPKNVGYQFRGYFLGERAIPTFQYRCGKVDIQDRSEVTELNSRQQLQRTFQFESTESVTVWFRAIAGDIRQESERVFRVNRLRLTLPDVETRIRRVATEPEQPERTELLVRVQVPQGKSTLEILYEPLPK